MTNPHNKVDISFTPTTKQVEEVKQWLISEKNESGEGFYSNWQLIIDAYEENELAIISINSQVIGFAVWNYPTIYTAKIDIMEIMPIYRNIGYGNLLVNQLFQKFIEDDIQVIDLECYPENSELFWRKLGLVDFPNNIPKWDWGNNRLYKILVPHQQTTQNTKELEYIELWDDEPSLVNEMSCSWKWKLEFKDGTNELLKPIVQPCHQDWRICWTKNEISVKDLKVKSLFKYPIYFEGYLIIKEISKDL